MKKVGAKCYNKKTTSYVIRLILSMGKEDEREKAYCLHWLF